MGRASEMAAAAPVDSALTQNDSNATLGREECASTLLQLCAAGAVGFEAGAGDQTCLEDANYCPYHVKPTRQFR